MKIEQSQLLTFVQQNCYCEIFWKYLTKTAAEASVATFLKEDSITEVFQGIWWNLSEQSTFEQLFLKNYLNSPKLILPLGV